MNDVNIWVEFIIKYSGMAAVIVAIVSAVFAFIANRESRQANIIAKEANKLSHEANTLSEKALSGSTTQHKQEITNSIRSNIIQNWGTSPGGAHGALKSQWEIYKNQGFSIDDFNNIWREAYFTKKGKDPKETAEEILLR